MNFDFSDFHPNCVNKILQLHDGKLMVVCLECGVAGELEAISTKVSVQDAFKVGKLARSPIGQRSIGHPKGAR